ncbi:nuclear transport factor 2 family protein [Zoogloea sp.]|uniref:nuclear transport factor 2 family protein n=1 Tax=Zoogloea sp. TaxID=49181 RepID=UPI00260BBD67|nr:nuclear transport factor 2 family protein [Zoogloea sp.]MDD3352072.1 nuclear transport factor 2 family protein [Zoogloea sp.]
MSDVNELALLQELEDKEALRTLNARFARALDRADRDLLAGLWAAGAQVEDGAFAGPASEYVAAAVNPAGLERSFHSISNEFFLIEGDKARGEVYVINVATWNKEGGKTDTLIGGRYVDEYARVEGAWKFARRTFIHEWNMSFPTTAVWDEGLFGMIKLRGLRSKDDPIYTVLGER